MSGAPAIAVLAGSPRRAGACAALARRVARGVEGAGGSARLLYLADYGFSGCTGCGACNATGTCVFDEREARAQAVGGKPGWRALYGEIARSDALALVAPVYFSGPPSQLKAFFDRMQPLWAERYLLGRHPVRPVGERRPFDLFAVGAGGDPFGYEALVSCARSSLRMADCELRELHDCVGYRAGGGLDEAVEQRVQEAGARLVAAVRGEGPATRQYQQFR